uniref:Putative homing endonuclease n=1 Tax=viral metagenome TaxID=1070528 RepID=A0A6M3J763_9ZZZZ
MGTIHHTGYGLITDDDQRQLRAHRVAYEQIHGAIPPGRCVLHRCDNRRCVNPAHLWVGTFADNNMDKIHKGRQNVKSSTAHWNFKHGRYCKRPARVYDSTHPTPQTTRTP